MEKYPFNGKNVLVTGASGGLGSALTRKLAQMGAQLVLSSRSETALNELISFFPDTTRVVPITVDLSCPGLCPLDRCGEPKFDIAEQVLAAAAGSPEEGWLERQGKWLSTAALIWPRYVDGRLARIRDTLVQTKSLNKRRWRLLQVESSIACNLSCLMCPWKEISKKAQNRGIMSEGVVWGAIRSYLSEVTSIDFTGGGEPLLQPKLTEWIAEAKSAGCETGFLTNAFILKKETARQMISAGADWIGVSMDGATADIYEEVRKGSSFERVCENLANLAALRNGKIPKTMINFVLMEMNFHQVEEIVRLAARLGVDQVNFKQCDVIRGEHGKGYGLFGAKETREIRGLKKDLAKARRLAKKLNVLTTAFSFTPEELPVCEQDPRDSLFIRHDGAVGPCINLAIGGPTTFLGQEVTMPTVHYGRLPDDDLLDLWETESCKFYRERFEDRVRAHDNTIVDSLMAASSSRHKTVEAAKEAMPEAPEGCKVCHYLYDI
jgi:MoaA/NifB/PqqE/SkfB family radical SAM enzyme